MHGELVKLDFRPLVHLYVVRPKVSTYSLLSLCRYCCSRVTYSSIHTTYSKPLLSYAVTSDRPNREIPLSVLDKLGNVGS